VVSPDSCAGVILIVPWTRQKISGAVIITLMGLEFTKLILNAILATATQS
jgi:hypothetical protein